MKPFWQRPPKKNKKKKRKLKPSLPKQTQLAVSVPKSSTWIPPYLVTSKVPVAEDTFIVKTPVTYQITADLKEQEDSAEVTIPMLPPPSEQPKQYPSKQRPRREFMKTFKKLTAGRWRSWDIWTDFLTMAACAISNAVDKIHYDKREELYLRTIKKYRKEEQILFPELFAYVVMALEENPEQDFLGDLYTELGLNSKEHRQIFTPYHVCHFMAQITFDDLVTQVDEKGVIEIHDCCCGAGATLIAAANVAKSKLEKADRNFQNHILVTGQDIDYVATMMCYIQLSLLGVAGYFKVGNALTEPMTDDDNFDNYWFTPMYYFPVWHYRRIWRMMDRLFKDEPTKLKGGAEQDAVIHED